MIPDDIIGSTWQQYGDCSPTVSILSLSPNYEPIFLITPLAFVNGWIQLSLFVKKTSKIEAVAGRGHRCDALALLSHVLALLDADVYPPRGADDTLHRNLAMALPGGSSPPRSLSLIPSPPHPRLTHRPFSLKI